MARDRHSAAAWPSMGAISADGGSRLDVLAANTRSPSIGVCAGTMARAKPSWAAVAMRLHPALSSVASVATTAIVVFSRRPNLVRTNRRQIGPVLQMVCHLLESSGTIIDEVDISVTFSQKFSDKRRVTVDRFVNE